MTLRRPLALSCPSGPYSGPPEAASGKRVHYGLPRNSGKMMRCWRHRPLFLAVCSGTPPLVVCLDHPRVNLFISKMEKDAAIARKWSWTAHCLALPLPLLCPCSCSRSPEENLSALRSVRVNTMLNISDVEATFRPASSSKRNLSFSVKNRGLFSRSANVRRVPSFFQAIESAFPASRSAMDIAGGPGGEGTYVFKPSDCGSLTDGGIWVGGILPVIAAGASRGDGCACCIFCRTC